MMTAKDAGLKIGTGTLLVGRQSFGSEPFLVEIGRDCLITDGVKFVTHDGAIQVPLIAQGAKIMDIYAKRSTFNRISIGNNVFIGIGSIILPGTNIGDNSIVAAGSVVRGNFEGGIVLGGNPGKIICDIKEYYRKNQGSIIDISDPADRVNIIKNATKRRNI